MANQAFTAFYNGVTDALFDFDTATWKASLVRGYTFNAAHVFLSDVTSAGGTLVSTVTLVKATPPRVDGALDCEDWTWPTVAAGPAIPAFIIYQASAVTGGADLAASAQRLVAYFDSQTGLPLTPTGVSVSYAVDNGINRLLRV